MECWGEFLFKLSDHGLEWAKILIPALITWHFKQPFYMKKKDPPEEK